MSLKSGLILIITIVITYIILDSEVRLLYSLSCYFILSLNKRFRLNVLRILKVMLLWIIIIEVIGYARIFGKTSKYLVDLDVYSAISILMQIMLCIYIFISIFKLNQILMLMDLFHLSRKLSYIFISTLASYEYFQQIGSRQYFLLTIKGIKIKNVKDKILSYYRITLPLLSLLLSRQIINARSLNYRHFFTERIKLNDRYPYHNSRNKVIIISAILNSIIWILL